MPLLKPIYCKKCRRKLVRAMFVTCSIYCPTCGTWTKIRKEDLSKQRVRRK